MYEGTFFPHPTEHTVGVDAQAVISLTLRAFRVEHVYAGRKRTSADSGSTDAPGGR